MDAETMIATTTIGTSTSRVFDVLADPSTHAAIDGTGWVRGPIEDEPLERAGQVFQMHMYHANHPDKHYEMANQVEVFDRPTAISWKPGQFSPDTGELGFGGWTWRYDLAPRGPNETEVTLTYDWSAVPADLRAEIQFPPFEQQHLDNSLRHLARLADEPRPE